MQTRSQTGSNSAPLFVDVVFVGDRSGSMQSMGGGLLKGSIKFVEMHHQLAEESGLGDSYNLRVVSFDHQADILYSGNATDFFADALHTQRLQEGLKPRGTTRLYDTICDEVKAQADRVCKFKASLHPSVLVLNPRIVVILAVLTDGCDNTSKCGSLTVHIAIKSHIKEFDAACQFIAANQDANYTGVKMGFPVETCLQMDADPEHAAAAMESVTMSCRRTISGESPEFSQAERTLSARVPSSWQPSFTSVPEDGGDNGDNMDSQPQRM